MLLYISTHLTISIKFNFYFDLDAFHLLLVLFEFKYNKNLVYTHTYKYISKPLIWHKVSSESNLWVAHCFHCFQYTYNICSSPGTMLFWLKTVRVFPDDNSSLHWTMKAPSTCKIMDPPPPPLYRLDLKVSSIISASFSASLFYFPKAGAEDSIGWHFPTLTSSFHRHKFFWGRQLTVKTSDCYHSLLGSPSHSYYFQRPQYVLESISHLRASLVPLTFRPHSWRRHATVIPWPSWNTPPPQGASTSRCFSLRAGATNSNYSKNYYKPSTGEACHTGTNLHPQMLQP